MRGESLPRLLASPSAEVDLHRDTPLLRASSALSAWRVLTEHAWVRRAPARHGSDLG